MAITLDATDEKIRATLDATYATAADFNASYLDKTSTAVTPGEANGTVNGTGETDLVTAPAASTQRSVIYIQVTNMHSAAVVATVIKDVGGTNRVLTPNGVSLATKESLCYEHGEGWYVLNASAERKNTSSGDSAQSANTVKAGPTSGGAAAPAYRSLVAADIANDMISDAHLRNSTALSVIGRTANSAGDPADIAASADMQILSRAGTALGFNHISSFDSVDIAVGDSALIYDTSGGKNQRILFDRLYGFPDPRQICDLRLSLESGIAVSTSDQSAKTSLYAVPFGDHANFGAPAGSARLALYDGMRWALYLVSELSIPTLSLTNAKPHDVFVYDNGGTVTLETLVWTDTTTRATELVLQDGVLMKNGALTRRYLGTIYATAANQTSDAVASRSVWNYYNQILRADFSNDATNSWSSSGTNGTWAAINGGNAAWKHEFVVGLNQAPVEAYTSLHSGIAGGYSGATALDSATVFTRTRGWIGSNNISTNNGSFVSGMSVFPGIGYHYIQGIETTSVAGAATVYGDNNEVVPYIQSGMLTKKWC